MPVNGLRADQEGSVIYINGGKLVRADGDTGFIKTASGVTSGYSTGAGSAVTVNGTFTGNTGSSAYTINDIVATLKNLGVLAA